MAKVAKSKTPDPFAECGTLANAGKPADYFDKLLGVAKVALEEMSTRPVAERGAGAELRERFKMTFDADLTRIIEWLAHQPQNLALEETREAVKGVERAVSLLHDAWLAGEKGEEFPWEPGHQALSFTIATFRDAERWVRPSYSEWAARIADGEKREGKRPGKPRPGESDSDTKTLAALRKWHQVDEDGRAGNTEAATNPILHETYGLSNNALTRFLKRKNMTRASYQTACGSKRIGILLVKWSGELPGYAPRLRDDED